MSEVDDDNIVCSSPLVLDNTTLLDRGDGTFVYRDLLFQLCSKEEQYSKMIPPNNCWPARIFVQKLFTAANRMHFNAVTTHTAVTLLKRLCVISPEYVQKQNPETICFVCLSLSAKMYEKRKRWVKELYRDTLLVCSKREFRAKEMEVLRLVDYRIDLPVPIQYVNLFLEIYFRQLPQLNSVATNVTHLLYSEPERLIGNHSALVCAIVVLCVAQSIMDGGASRPMIRWAKTFLNQIEEITTLSNELFEFIFKTDRTAQFVY
ncbi:hypothetical protein EIN_371510 [Entamoeba invadens IP1]|uniref:Cyclin-like domain-containing protein n=1 Tax=Entamoeba invadens IP1 TaxID=370355 RepID=A0A0A1UFL1_ENTIV|nr:hypothetical protein EIN_371510 [Entamoeba invadens IP1]ELP92739.1 hypothetical protein EIN_371510 [Entamoeba invadens IP1]|eukprot:XP_004259510.1 hypothetical protein EIN_371510 [Entamoeba invadens IP1]